MNFCGEFDMILYTFYCMDDVKCEERHKQNKTKQNRKIVRIMRGVCNVVVTVRDCLLRLLCPDNSAQQDIREYTHSYTHTRDGDNGNITSTR